MATEHKPFRGSIVGLSRTSLRKAWGDVRRELRSSTVRDVVDHLEYDLKPDVWIDRLLAQISTGVYEPQSAFRFSIAKSNGFSRRMTSPVIPDCVLYRAIGTYLQDKLRYRERQHVYFERRKLEKVQQEIKNESVEGGVTPQSGWEDITANWMDYESQNKRRKRAWLHYSQYRKLLIFKRIFPFIITTDITNFFDTILHDKLEECFRSIAAPPRMIGLLFFLLERLSIREAFSDSPRVGLPVDEFDCSCQIVHLFLYSHDDRVVGSVGEEAYVRWMDDQNIGAASRAEALRALARVGESLGHLHLTANAGKSRILTLSQARRHFHLDINDKLDAIEPLVRQPKPPRKEIAKLVRDVWHFAKQYENVGEWDKILKRLYRYAVLGSSRALRRRCAKDIMAHPRLADRVAEYVCATGTTAEFLAFANQIWAHEEQIYADVNAVIFERLLRLEPDSGERRQVLAIAFQVLNGKWKRPGANLCACIAPLVVLRYGTKRSARRLRTYLKQR